MSERNFLSFRGLCERYYDAYAPATLRTRTASRQIPHIKHPGGSTTKVLYPVADLDLWEQGGYELVEEPIPSPLQGVEPGRRVRPVLPTDARMLRPTRSRAKRAVRGAA